MKSEIVMPLTGDKANKQFVCEYKFDGSKWGLNEVWASTHEEAEMKLKAIAKGKVLGILKGTIPAHPCPICGYDGMDDED